MKQIDPQGESPATLSCLRPGQRARVGEVTGSNASVGHMAAMGISRGAEILMIRNHKRLPLIVEVRETFLAMGRGEAEKIRV